MTRHANAERPTVTIRLRRELIRALDRVAAERHLSRSAAIEIAVEEYLRSYGAYPLPEQHQKK